MGGIREFGAFLRESRLKSGYGLRFFATAMEMQPSNLSSIEHGRIAPPQSPDTLERIAEALGFDKGSPEWNRLFDLAVKHKEAALPADIARYAGSTPGIPVVLRTIENKKLSEDELRELTDYIRQGYPDK